MTDNTSDLRTYSFPAYRLGKLEAKLAAANSKLGRAGISEKFTIETLTHFDREVTKGGIVLDDGTIEPGTGITVTEPWVEVTINMVPIKLGNYTFVASLIPEQAGMTVHTAPGQSLEGWTRPEATDMTCEHCKVRRYRNRLYVVRNEDTGTLVQVGHNCIEVYTGCAPKGLWALTWDEELKGFADEDTGSGFGNSDYGILVADVLGMAFAFTNEGRNYVSRNAAEATGREATSVVVREALLYPPRRPSGKNPRALAEWEAFMAKIHSGMAYAKDEALIADIRAAAASIKDGSDYGENMKILLDCERVSGRNVGILASLVAVYARQKELAVQRERAPKAASGFIAPVGTRVKEATKILLKTVKTWESDYGDTTLMIGWTEDGHILKWKASGDWNVNVGDTLILTAFTVTEHAQWKDQDQTVVKRAKVGEHIRAKASEHIAG